MTQEVFVLAQADDVVRLRKRLNAKRALVVRIAAPELEEAHRLELERKVERHMRACGCNEGTMAGLLYVAAIPALYIAGGRVPASLAAWAGVGAGLLAALLGGKLLGLGVARLRLRQALGRVRHILERGVADHA